MFVAIGTSFPELGVSIAAAKNKLGSIMIGNAIGSVITNAFLILGIAAIIKPLAITAVTITFTTPFLIFASLVLLFFIKTNWEIRKVEGIMLLLLYVIFLAGLFYLI